MSSLKNYLIATLGWFAWYAILMNYFWAFYSSHHPFLDWAISILLPDYKFPYYFLIYSSDIVLSILLAFPFALLMQRWLPPSPWKYIALAVTAVFLWEYRVVLSNFDTLLFFISTPSAYFGFVLTLGLLPLTYLLSRWLRARYAA